MFPSDKEPPLTPLAELHPEIETLTLDEAPPNQPSGLVYQSRVDYTNPEGQVFHFTIRATDEVDLKSYLRAAKVWLHATPIEAHEPPASSTPEALGMFLEALRKLLDINPETLSHDTFLQACQRANADPADVLSKAYQAALDTVESDKTLTEDQRSELRDQLERLYGGLLQDLEPPGRWEHGISVHIRYGDEIEPGQENEAKRSLQRIDFAVDPPVCRPEDAAARITNLPYFHEYGASLSYVEVNLSATQGNVWVIVRRNGWWAGGGFTNRGPVRFSHDEGVNANNETILANYAVHVEGKGDFSQNDYTLRGSWNEWSYSR